MTGWNRRSVLLGGVFGPAVFLSDYSATAQVDTLGEGFSPTVFSLAYDPLSPVQYWNRAAVELVATDHTVAVSDARAPGPCASARALALVHAAVADAVAHVYEGSNFTALLNKTKPAAKIDVPEVFVGGCAFAVLSHIFTSNAHVAQLGAFERNFTKLFGGLGKRVNAIAWTEGLTFGRSADFLQFWDWANDIEPRLVDQSYRPSPGEHDVDPWNPGQGFYGLRWGGVQPLVLENTSEVEGLRAPPPPSITPREIDLLLAKGGISPVETGGIPPRTQREKNTGLFWAYDGARHLGTPPVLYNNVLLESARKAGLTARSKIPELARLLALAHLAMGDASIVAWESKWFYRFRRPVLEITASRDPNWHPLGSPRTNPDFADFKGFEPSAQQARDVKDTAVVLVGASRLAARAEMRTLKLDSGESADLYARSAFTPNFPAYPSGHATLGGAAFDLLRQFRLESLKTEESAQRVDLKDVVSGELDGAALDNFTGDLRPSVPRDFPTIGRAGGDESSLIGSNERSRVYLGVHWSFDQPAGSAAGAEVARRVFTRAYRPPAVP